MTEHLIPWLNGRLDLRQAYTFDRNNIIAMLQNIVLSPVVYGVIPQNVTRLISIHQDITRLRCPDGQDYLAPAPPQSIDRQLHPRWPRGIARFQLRRSTYDGVEYWALPDLLGLFLSSLGPAPMGATKRNFYLPVTAVYGQWCTKLLTGGDAKGIPVFLDRWEGVLSWCSRGGFAVQEGIGSWPAVLDRARYGIIRSPELQITWSQTWTPTLQRLGGHGWPFGRCAETYPFCKLLMDKTREEAGRVYGLALCDKYIGTAPVYVDRLSGRIWCHVAMKEDRGR
ncbi:hypothetical protein ABOM_003405 [Aspergillus bombycis]|uniref:Uncharacterized protein n=1 Tax=Aspergillus bombycis TaxID=109264 RepID=A0A1F8A9L7_9EURO|nr:hypothetical protein ABOM_003405 [Aspergillus bombycis]OGM48397.1 hypothetical protein ABOM_003405 [Aspergillus bombycis]